MTGSEFAALRKSRGLTQKQLAALCNMPYRSIQKIEHDETQLDKIQLKTAQKLATALKVDITIFLQEDMKMNEIKDTANSAAALYDGGWRSTDKEQLIAEHGLTASDADKLCAALAQIEKDELLEMIRDWKADNAPEYDDLEIGDSDINPDTNKLVVYAQDNKTAYCLSDDGTGNIAINYIGTR